MRRRGFNLCTEKDQNNTYEAYIPHLIQYFFLVPNKIDDFDFDFDSSFK